MSAFEEAISAWVALKVAVAQAAALPVGGAAEVDIPDIEISARIKGQSVRVKVTSVNIERVS